MPLSQESRTASVVTAAGADTFVLYRMTGKEQLSSLFEYELELLSENGDIDLQTVLGTSITVKLQLDNGALRPFNGIVTQINQFGMLGDLYFYRAIVHPKVWLLTQASNCRVLSPSPATKNVPDMVKAVLTEHGYTDVTTKFSTTYQPRDFCVQYRETDFNFISRLLEEEGIYYYFTHTDSNHSLVLCDDITKLTAATPATVKYYPAANQGGRDEEHFYQWRLGRQIRSGSYRLKDFDFEATTAPLDKVTELPGEHAQASKTVYDYPGEFKVDSEGERYSRLRMEELRAEHEQTVALGNIRTLAVGQKFTLSEFPRADQNREYLTVSTQFQIQNNDYGIAEAGGMDEFQCTYSVISTEYAYRPPRRTRVPVVQGVQTAIVVGASGDEILTDQYGRVKVQFHWDRLGTKNENSSFWVRVAQIWAGNNWGSMFIPRVGQEVIVDFLEGNPDNPIITGRVYNAQQMPPYALDANKTQSGIKTRSTPNGAAENFNEIRFEDKKDSEELYIHAEKNFTRIVENNDVQKIGFEKKDAGDQTVDIYNHRTITLDQGNDKLTVKTGNHTVEIDKGNDSLTVTQGNRTIKVNAGSISEEAGQSIELKVGSNSIKIDQSGVTIKGMTVKIQADTQAELKGLQTTVSGDGMLTLKGGMVMIN
ncbi:type VI secretion system tip protein VgrG [Methylomonas sp. MO1]|uniref:type VI secretion system Vgr family protein n=1 Tax=Methylomonas sp. MO1 TaxID=3073619 RepID=UPI0028A3AD72|nr:type VI secretion system tip protein VgrG [Methylomonas sp. MO1]MDT4289900.1 type VI secretion system tip protein VgrG [Methylomonas sp. MO1]